jgi:chemotaxis family two-component system response regulator Rcp1
MPRYRPVRVLVVEDNPDDVEITRRAFGRARVTSELSVARDGREVIDTLTRDGEGGRVPLPDLVLLDINLPKLSGFEVLAAIRTEDGLAAVPVIMLTASGRHEDVIESYRRGANSYIQKPVSFEAFLEALEVLARYWFDVATLP